MKIVITGALGYVGSFLIRDLPRQFPESEFILLDNLSTGSKKALKGLKNKRIHFIKGDIRSFNFKRLNLKPGDLVIHLAGLSRPLESFGNASEFFEVNCSGALRTAEACAKSGAFFFFPSTTSVYHRTGEKWVKDCDTYIKPQTPYAASKLKAEHGLKKIKGLRYTVVRFGTIYGSAPAMSLQTAVNKFCWQAATQKPISIWKTALDQYRPYLDLTDAARLITFLIRQKEFSGKTYNAVTNHATPKQVIREIKRHCIAKVEKVPAEAMNRLSYKVSRKPLEKLGFEFRGSLKDSVKRILNEKRF